MSITAVYTDRMQYVHEAQNDVIHDWLTGYATDADIVGSLQTGDAIRAAQEWAEGHNHRVYRHCQEDLKSNGLLDAYLAAPTLTDAVDQFLTDVFLDGVREAIDAMAEAGAPAAERYVAEGAEETYSGRDI